MPIPSVSCTGSGGKLAFKEWKSYASLHSFETENASIAEGFLWASLCAAFLKRALAFCTQLALDTRRTVAGIPPSFPGAPSSHPGARRRARSAVGSRPKSGSGRPRPRPLAPRGTGHCLVRVKTRLLSTFRLSVVAVAVYCRVCEGASPPQVKVSVI